MIPVSRWLIIVVLTLSISTYGDGKQCKIIKKPRCYLPDPVDQQKLTTTVHAAIARGRHYLQKQLKFPQIPHVKACMKKILTLSSLYYDNKTCYKTANITHQVTGFTYEGLKKLSGGKLAIMLMSMQATCSFKSKEEQHKAVLLLKRKMKAFPKGEFNHFFQYSLAIIALYNNGEHISSEFARTLINDFFLKKLGRYNHLFSSDTKAVALVALKAIRKQKLNDHWVREQAVRILKRAEKHISTVLLNEDNYNSFILLASVFDIRQKAVCKSTMKKILSRQKPDGSFGKIPTTANSIIALTGYSKLILKDVRCNVQVKPTETTDETNKDTDEHIPGDKGDKKIENQVMIGVNISISYAIPELAHLKEQTTVQIPSGLTALDALEKASKINPCFTARTKLTAWGKQIIELCRMEQNHDKRMYWMFFVNGGMAKVGPSTYKPKDGDKLRFTLTKF